MQSWLKGPVSRSSVNKCLEFASESDCGNAGVPGRSGSGRQTGEFLQVQRTLTPWGRPFSSSLPREAPTQPRWPQSSLREDMSGLKREVQPLATFPGQGPNVTRPGCHSGMPEFECPPTAGASVLLRDPQAEIWCWSVFWKLGFSGPVWGVEALFSCGH